MKAQPIFLAAVFFFLSIWRGDASPNSMAPPPEYQATNGEFDLVGQAVLDLLQSKNAARFAASVSVSEADWNSLATMNLTEEERDRVKQFAKGAVHNASRLESDGQSLLDRANSLHLDFSKGDWRFRITPPQHIGGIYFLARPKDGGSTLPYVQLMEAAVTPFQQGALQTNESCKLILTGVEKYPAGWRISERIQWESFPSNLMDQKTAHEVAIMDKVAKYEPITSDDDPNLLKLGESLVRFIRTGDTNYYRKDVMINLDLIWSTMQKMPQKGPSRKELDEEGGRMLRRQEDQAWAVLKQMKDAGIDLANADIQVKFASIKYGQPPHGDGSLDGMTGGDFKARLSVKSNKESATGAPLSGDYILSADQIMRFGEDWRVSMGLRWEQFPDGVMDGAAAKNLEFENYVAEHRALPPETPAPEIAFTTLAGEKRMKLSDLRGKVVLLDFWATWCGPCQEPMAELQKIRRGHSNWGDKVAIVPISIDDTMDIVRNHVNQRGWTNTFNVWAGEGGWYSDTGKAFRVSQVPTTYVIDTRGKIVFEGYPDDAALAATIDELLK